MRIIYTLTLCFFSLLMSAQTVTSHIHIDQFGYLPSADKIAVISDPQIGYNASAPYTPGTSFQLRKSSDNLSVWSGSATVWDGGNTHIQSGDKGWWVDFSSITAPDTYYLYDVDNDTKSFDFEIKEDIYHDILKSATKMFYYNRCNAPKQVPYAESNWTDADNFNNALQDSFCRYVYDSSNAALEKDLSGGWFDAGDYNKYVTFAVKPIHQLLYAYEESTEIFTDNWNIPESSNGIPDLIDEIKWEMDWLKKMVNTDGTVINKMGSIDHGENAASPPSNNFDQRYYGPTCTSSSIAAAGMLAHAALVFENIPQLTAYASTLESKAIDCFDYVLPLLNADALETDCDDGTIKAGDADWDTATQKQRAVLASIYLWELTDDQVYHNYLIDNLNDINFINDNWLGNQSNEELEALLHYATLPGANQTVVSEVTNSITPHISQDWNNFYGSNDLDLYRSYMPDWAFHWGSNLPKADFAILNRIIKNYDVNPSQNDSYEEKTAAHVHYFHGVNPQNIVYLSNMYSRGGDNCANEIYHTWFADGTDYDNALTSPKGPAPGFVVGGSNKDFTITSIAPPSGQPDQKSYLDFNTGYPDNSWEITEPAIYYQAAYLRLLAAYTNDLCSTKSKLYVDESASGAGTGNNWADAYNSLDAALEDVCLVNVDTIYIAEGIYTPVSNNRADSYSIDTDMVIKGGYCAGGHTYDVTNNRAILSGNIGNLSSATDNLYHVLFLPTKNIQIHLMNLKIKNGYANGSNEDAQGAGIYAKSNLILENVEVSENSALNDQEGIFIKDPSVVTVQGITEVKNNIKL